MGAPSRLLLEVVVERAALEWNIDVGGVSQATLNMEVGSTLAGSVTTGQGTGNSILFYYRKTLMYDKSFFMIDT